MALLRTTDEVKQYVSIDKNTAFSSLIPSLGWAQRLIGKYLGSALYTALDAAYNAGINTASAPLQALLPYVQAPLANLLVGKWITIGQVSISDAGVRIRVDNTNKTAFAWQMGQVKQELFYEGYNQLEVLLEFLEANKVNYPTWVASTGYTIRKDTIIPDALTFSRDYQINDSRRLFLAMLPAMRKVETLLVKRSITDGVYTTLKTKIRTGDIDLANAENTAYRTLLELLQPAVANLTIARSLIELPMELTENGVILNELAATEGKTEKSPTADQLSPKMESAYQDGMQYLADAVEYLKDNASLTLFESFYTLYLEQSVLPTQAGKSIYLAG